MGRRITTISISTQHHLFIIISDNNRISTVSCTQHQHALAGIPQSISTILSDLHSISIISISIITIISISIISIISISIILPASHKASAPFSAASTASALSASASSYLHPTKHQLQLPLVKVLQPLKRDNLEKTII